MNAGQPQEGDRAIRPDRLVQACHFGSRMGLKELCRAKSMGLDRANHVIDHINVLYSRQYIVLIHLAELSALQKLLITESRSILINHDLKYE